VPSKATLEDVLTLKNRITELEQESQKNKFEPPSGSEELKQGDDEYEIKYSFIQNNYSTNERESYTGSIRITWNQIFAAIAPCLLNESPENQLSQAFITCFKKNAVQYLKSQKEFQKHSLGQFDFAKTDIETCIIQFRALGLICESKKSRSVKDPSKYWTLTPYGDYLMTQLRAIRKTDGEGNSETI
jgi:hypothetical protein